ncbi:MAG: ribosomal L7Ae/L30e/S12e/Gadd45 family protein [Eubacteriales bacterium]
MPDQIKVSKNVIGTKQTLKVIKCGNAKKVFLARDVDKHIYDNIERYCQENNVQIVYMESMEELGKACGINRKTATAAILNN